MNDSHILDLLNDYIDGTISDKQKHLVETHINHCPHCAKELRQLQLVIKRVQTLPSEIHPPENLLEGIESRLHTPESNLLELQHRNNGIHIQDEQKRFSFSLVYRIAAGFVVLMAAGVVWYLLQDSKPEGTQQTQIERNQQSEQNITSTPESKEVQPEIKITEQNVPSSTIALDSQSQHKKELRTSVNADSSLASTAVVKPSDTIKTIVVQQAETTMTQPKSSSTGTITGKVVDTEGNPLVGTTVVVVGTTRGGVTDNQGNFSIIGIPKGSYSLRISNIGYASIEITSVQVEAKQSTPLNATLQSSAVAMSEVTIRADQVLVQPLTTSSARSATQKPSSIPPSAKSEIQIGQLQSGDVKQGNNARLRGGRA
ncbi:MAG: carboxypeptidase regulatory-like domain-containing protein, partial [Ignavibacteriales bacterium]|nr:carboxypeptidase regulatory-like domain-containing protein [Ignavibacteriales bacterium]